MSGHFAGQTTIRSIVKIGQEHGRASGNAVAELFESDARRDILSY